MSHTHSIHLQHDNIKPLDNGFITFTVSSINVSRWEFLNITGLNLPANPSGVFVSVRAPNNDNPQYSDSFVLTVNHVVQNSIILKIWRVDSSDNPSAPIRIDGLVIP